VLIACMLAAFLMAIAIPDAFGERAGLFAGGYVALQWVRNTFVVLATDDSEPMHASWVRMWIGSLWVGLIWIAGAIEPDEGARTAIWMATLPLVVAEEPDITIAETLVTIARERDAPAIVVGAHGHGTLGEVILDSTSRDVIRRAEQPVVIAREPRR
jgi:nucleotide-binding universal stress UspA family protein